MPPSRIGRIPVDARVGVGGGAGDPEGNRFPRAWGGKRLLDEKR